MSDEGYTNGEVLDGPLINSAVVGVDYVAPGDEPAPEPQTSTKAHAGYDPAAHTVDEVQAHVAKYPGEAAAVLTAERAGKNRVTLVEALEEATDE